MREIKFRAWDKKEKVMCNVEVISLFGEKGCFLLGNSPTPDFIGDEFIVKGDDSGHFVKFKDLELMQYTGLRDENNREIYEGDILSFEVFAYKTQGIVKYIENGFWLTNEIGDRYVPDLEYSEVIGNIYENPELLSNLNNRKK